MSSAALRRIREFAGSIAARCELCSASLLSEHEHVLAPGGELECVCLACSLLFTERDDPSGRRRIERRIDRADDVVRARALERLSIPVAPAFLLSGPPRARLPGPAGLVEAHLEADAWRAVAADAPTLATLEPDVACVAVAPPGRGGAYAISIDLYHRLAGEVREAWSGLTGGPAVQLVVTTFFTSIEEGARG